MFGFLRKNKKQEEVNVDKEKKTIDEKEIDEAKTDVEEKGKPSEQTESDRISLAALKYSARIKFRSLSKNTAKRNVAGTLSGIYRQIKSNISSAKSSSFNP